MGPPLELLSYKLQNFSVSLCSLWLRRCMRGQRDGFRNFFYEGDAGLYVKKAVELAGISGF